MPKQETCLAAFRPVTDVFYESLHHGHTALIDALKPLMFQGFEWDGHVETRRTRNLSEVSLEPGAFAMPRPSRRKPSWPARLRFWNRAA